MPNPKKKLSVITLKPSTSGTLAKIIGREQHVEETFPIADHVVSGGIHSTQS